MRFAFGGTAADYAYVPTTVEDTGGQLVSVVAFQPRSPISFYDAAVGGTQLPVTDADGNPRQVYATDEGWIPGGIYGPDGVMEMWAAASGGPRVRMLPDTGQAIRAEIEARSQADADTLTAANTYTDDAVAAVNGGGGGAVASVNGQTGAVVLDAAAVGARAVVDAVPSEEVTGLAAVATTGSYGDLSDRPNLSRVATTGAYQDLSGKPSVYTKTESDQRYQIAGSGATYPDTLRAWFDAIEVRDRHGLDVLVVGDSWGEGQGASAIGNRWLDRLRNQLRGVLNPSHVPGGVGYVPSYYVLSNLTSPWAYTGTATKQTVFGLGKRQMRLSTGASMSLTFTGTGIDFFYAAGGSGGNIEWRIDGGVSNAGGSENVIALINTGQLNANEGGKLLRLRGLWPGTHTLRIDKIGGTNYWAYVEGAMVYHGDTVGGPGVRVWDSSHWGYDCVQTLAADNPAWYASLQHIPADLVMVPLGINDWRHKQVAPVEYAANLRTLVTTIRQQLPGNPSVMLWTMPETAPVTSEIAPWSQFKSQVANVAAEVGAYVFDASAVVPDVNAGDMTLWDPDQIHPNNAGHAALAAALADVLLPTA